MTDVMLDLETMGTSANAAIVAIGAVEFDIERTFIGRKFYAVVNLQSAIENGGVVDGDTIRWWLGQSDEARAAIRVGDEHINVALIQFSGWLDPEARVWGNGAAFDNVILASAYRRSQIELPWKFWNDRCYRTIKSLHGDVPIERIGTHHNALDDAETQANHLMRILAR